MAAPVHPALRPVARTRIARETTRPTDTRARGLRLLRDSRALLAARGRQGGATLDHRRVEDPRLALMSFNDAPLTRGMRPVGE